MKKITSAFVQRAVGAIILAIGITAQVHAQQEEYAITFQNETLSLTENIQSFQWEDLNQDSKISNGYYVLLQFYATPLQQVQDELKAQGIELLDYIGSKTYMAYVPSTLETSYLENKGARAISEVPGNFKLSEDLRLGIIGDWATRDSNILVTLQYHDKVSADFVIQDLATKQISVEQQYKGYTTLELSIPNNCLEALSNLSYVKYVEVITAPDEKEDTPARSLHRASGLDTQTDAGRNYTGAGIGVLVRDDGVVGPHIDFEGRINNTQASGMGATHGDGVAGILAGAGNLNPNYRGMAAGSDVYVVNYEPSFLDGATTGLINDGSVQITNSSYGNGCNGGYSSIARTVDEQTSTTPSLLHVFSCGNSGGSNCNYGAGVGWGTITGGHKQGKNVIATANVFSTGNLVGSSSWGPATDGRIKPDIAANGQNQISTDENNEYLSFGGTSGASPGIAGISAQLYEAYAQANGGALPESGLIKATLLNTANDAGNVGPDFKFGWGIVNGLRAGKLIEEGRYLMDTATQGATNNHTITVPAGTTQVRFMLYWTDPAAAPGAATALVNDLDLVVTDPLSNDLMPWILDPTPNSTALNTPATNGADHLNNMEQVLINNPQAGNYTLEIAGFDVPVGPQDYYVVYEIIEDQITVTYPNEGESLIPGTSEAIHWDAYNLNDSFAIEYSLDGGSTYNAIANVGSSARLLNWTVPADVSGQVKVRVTNGSISDESDGVFSIANQVTGLSLDQACPTEATFSWDPVEGANSYDLYILGDQYMEIAGTTTTASITVPIGVLDDEMWYAITASNTQEGWTSERTIASFYEGGLFECVLTNDLTITQILSDSSNFSGACGDADGIVTATIENNGVADQTNFTISYQLSGQDAVQETFPGTLAAGETVDFSFTTLLAIANNGEYNLEVATSAEGDEFIANDALSIDFFIQVAAEATPFEEGFETTGFPSDGWTLLNEDGDETWTEVVVPGSQGGNTTTGFVNNFVYNAGGSEDIIETLVYDIELDGSVLKFDLAKAQFSATFSDALRVDISTDCGTTFSPIYEKGGLDLSTIASYTASSWSPTSANDWRTEEIDLSAYTGQGVMFRIVNIGGFGNGTFVDNINIDSELSVVDNALTGVSLFPNPAQDQVTIALPSTLLGDTTFEITNNLGQVVHSFKQQVSGTSLSIDISNLSRGLYFIAINNQDQRTVEKLLVR